MRDKIVVLDSIRSMQNVGAIFRNADGAGFKKVILCWTSPTPPRSHISKTALWAQNWIEWEYWEDIIGVIWDYKKQGYKIIALETWEWVRDFRDSFLQSLEKVCLILWNEVSGIDKKILGLCDEIIMIPMKWKKESLNVSVAAGIAMYAFLDQKI